MSARAPSMILRRAILLGALPLVAGCASILGRSPEDRAVTVELPVSRSTAVRRALSALREQGYEVRESLTSGLDLTTETFRHGDRAEGIFRVVIAGTAESSTATITGTYRERQFGGIVLTKEREITRSDEGLEGELWARLVNLGLAIRSAR